MWSKATRWSWLALIGSLAMVMLLLVPTGSSAFTWGQWVEAAEVTETSATVELYIHPLWPETHWTLYFYAGHCETEPERCDDNFLNYEAAATGTVIQKSPYEIAEVDVPIPGLMFENSLRPAKLYEFTLYTAGEGEPTAPGLGSEPRFSDYDSLETSGPLGPEEQAHKAKIEKARTKRAKHVGQAQKQRAVAEKMLAKDRKKSEG